MTIETKTKPTVGSPTKLMIHIIKREENGALKDTTLCGKLWDHPVATAEDMCEECLEVAERDGHKWQR